VHEDLICLTSTLFKQQLQKHRKLLPPSGTTDVCCVCYDDLDPTTKDIAYCVTCGKNIHELCIENWKRKSDQQRHDRPPPTCPMCRATWKNEPLLKNLTISDDLDAAAVQMYLDWLYSTDLRIPARVDRATDAFNVALLKCWAVASAVQDDAFKGVVLAAFFTEAGAQFWRESIHWVFEDGYGNAEIRSFVIEVFMAFMEPGWFRQREQGLAGRVCEGGCGEGVGGVQEEEEFCGCQGGVDGEVEEGG
jgi:hypothetical protein